MLGTLRTGCAKTQPQDATSRPPRLPSLHAPLTPPPLATLRVVELAPLRDAELAPHGLQGASQELQHLCVPPDAQRLYDERVQP